MLTADLLDAHPDRLQSCETQLLRFGGHAQFHGRIRTVRCRDDSVLIKRVLEEPGDAQVLVVDGGGSLRCALLGDLTAVAAASRGWAGVIVFGVVRDVVALGSVAMGVKAIGTNPRRAEQAGAGEVDRPVTFGAATFAPGALVWSDEDGLITGSLPV